MTSQQIKAYVALRHVDQITRFETASNEQIVRAYQFTDQLRSAAVQLLTNVVSGRGASAIVGERGSGKSHMLSFLRSLANQPDLISALEDSEASVALQKAANGKIPADGMPTLSIGFDQDKGLNFVRAHPKAPGLEGELPDWLSMDQIDELIEERIKNSSNFALFIDGISQLLKNSSNADALLEWLRYLVAEAASGQFSLMITLDREIIDEENALAKDLRSLFYLERLSMINIATLIGQTVFRKIPQQHRALETLYRELRTRMPHFSGTPTEFIQLYPVHPIVLQIAPSMRRFARSFSLFGFIKAVGARALVRRAFSLICLDDLFESFEFDLRKNSKLKEMFAVYDHLFTSVVPNFGQQHSLYGKMMLKGLLLLSLAGKAATAGEVADAVMLYDDQEPKNFRKVITLIMERLAAASPGIIVEGEGSEPHYLLRSAIEAIEPEDVDTGEQKTEDTQETSKKKEATQIHKAGEYTKVSTRIINETEADKSTDKASEASNKTTLSPAMTISNANLDLLNQFIIEPGQPPAAKPKGKFEQLSEAAARISDDDLRLDQLLVSAGKKHFKDWPFTFEQDGNFRDRSEINIRWRGSLRKGILKFGGDIEIHSMVDKSLDDARPICEYDWQITVSRAYISTTASRTYTPIMGPPSADIPPTMLYWKPAELTEQERLALKHLFIAKMAGTQLFDAEQAKSIMAASEAEVAQIFSRAYLQEGKLLANDGTEIELNPQSSTFINSSLTKLLDGPLSVRYPHHPNFDELLDPDYINDMASWMFSQDDLPTPDQQMYLEQFARPLELLRLDHGRYRLDVSNKDFPSESPIGQLLEALEQSGAGPLSKPAAYQIVRREPFGLQRPALLLILAALAADGRVTLVDEFGDPIHNEQGLSRDAELSDFSAICIPGATQTQQLSWRNRAKREATGSHSYDYKDYTILIVDDDTSIHLLMEQAAKPLGCRVEKALDGVEAIAKLQSMSINLVISDLRMPNMTGIELFYFMRSDPSYNNVPFIVLTSVEVDEEAANALESGVEDYWFKPFRVQEITVRIKRLFRRRMTTTGAYARVAWPAEVPSETSRSDETNFAPATAILKNSEVNEILAAAQENNESRAIKTDNKEPKGGQPSKIFPSTAVSRLPAGNTGKALPIPHPPVPETAAPEEPAPVDISTAEEPDTKSQSVTPPSTDELVIPSVTSEFPISPEGMPQFVVDKDSGEFSKPEVPVASEGSVIFSITMTNPEANPFDIMMLYNQFWDSCRRAGPSTSTPEYEDFKSSVVLKTTKLKKQFNCDELVFTVEMEEGTVHVNCQVNSTDEYLKTPPKFRLF